MSSALDTAQSSATNVYIRKTMRDSRSSPGKRANSAGGGGFVQLLRHSSDNVRGSQEESAANIHGLAGRQRVEEIQLQGSATVTGSAGRQRGILDTHLGGFPGGVEQQQQQQVPSVLGNASSSLTASKHPVQGRKRSRVAAAIPASSGVSLGVVTGSGEHQEQQLHRPDLGNPSNSHSVNKLLVQWTKRVAAAIPGDSELSLETALEVCRNLTSLILNLSEREKKELHCRKSELKKLWSEKAAALSELGKLKAENKRQHAMREAASTAKFAEWRAECTKREATTLAGVLLMCKALMLKEKSKIEEFACLMTRKLRTNLAAARSAGSKLQSHIAAMDRDKIEKEKLNCEKIEELRSSLAAARSAGSKLQSDIAAMEREKAEKQGLTCEEIKELQSNIAVASIEIAELRLDKTALVKEKEEIGEVLNLELEKLRSTIADAHLELSDLHNKNAEWRKDSREISERKSVLLQSQIDMLRCDLATANGHVTRLQSEKAAFLIDKEQTREGSTQEMAHLQSRLEETKLELAQGRSENSFLRNEKARLVVRARTENPIANLVPILDTTEEIDCRHYLDIEKLRSNIGATSLEVSQRARFLKGQMLKERAEAEVIMGRQVACDEQFPQTRNVNAETIINRNAQTERVSQEEAEKAPSTNVAIGINASLALAEIEGNVELGKVRSGTMQVDTRSKKLSEALEHAMGSSELYRADAGLLASSLKSVIQGELDKSFVFEGDDVLLPVIRAVVDSVKLHVEVQTREDLWANWI